MNRSLIRGSNRFAFPFSTLMLLNTVLIVVLVAELAFVGRYLSLGTGIFPFIAAGAFFGILLSLAVSRMWLSSLSRTGEWLITLKYLLFVLSLIVLIVPAIVQLFSNSVPTEVQSGVFSSILFLDVTFISLTTTLVFRWERTNKTTIYQDFTSLYVIPKQPSTPQAYFQTPTLPNPMETDQKFQSSFGKIRGWLPQEPQLPKANIGAGTKKANMFDLPLKELSLWSVFSTAVGFLLIVVGIETLAFNDIAIAAAQVFTMFLPLAGLVGYFFGFWLAIAGGIVLLVLILTKTISGAFWRRNFTLRRMVPYGVSACLFYLGWLVSTSGVQFSYALPIAFLASGIIVVVGLHRFAVTVPAFVVLLVSMLFFGTAFAGITTVTYVTSEEHFLATADAPNVTTLNITAWTLESSINVYFSDNASQLCNMAFVEQYGLVNVGLSTTVLDKSAWENVTAPQYNCTIENNQANITVLTDELIVNITVNQNVKLNLDLSTTFGTININSPPSANNLQKIVAFSKYGNINLEVSDTTNLQSLAAQAGRSLVASIVTNGQNQNASVLLMGGTTTLNLEVANVASQVTAYQNSNWGTEKTKTDGFTILNPEGAAFKAQTPNYDSSNPKLDITASANTDTQPNMEITATYHQK